MLTRRQFVAGAAGTALYSSLPVAGEAAERKGAPRVKPVSARVALIHGGDRKEAVGRAIELLERNPVAGCAVLVKPNFNTADPFPASTHNDTLAALLDHVKKMGATSLTVGERSGPPATGEVMREMGIAAICRSRGVGLINFEDLPETDWVRMRPDDSHWADGFDVARPVFDAECVVATCCLKTHRYGGVFTMSLKLAVGITHKRNMSELHGSRRHMRRMIAEINQVYRPALILMDGTEVFTDGGPMTGTKKRAGLMLAATDRVAIDAVGLAVLKDLGSNDAIMGRPIFEQEQIARAVELGLGVGGPGEIDIVADDAAGREYASRLMQILASEG